MAKAKSEQSATFLEKKELLEYVRKTDLLKHQYKMKEFEFLRESEKIKHEKELERGRIKSAEIRKMQERRSHNSDFNKYAPAYEQK